MLHKHVIRTLFVLALAAVVTPAVAQTTVKEDFTSTTTQNTWLSFNGACLTAGTSATAGSLPGCLKNTYYNISGTTQSVTGTPQTQFGGNSGYLGSTSASGQSPDPDGSGALRLTNGSALSDNFADGYHQNGAIFSNFSFPSSSGINITFKTLTYGGNSGGNGGGSTVSANDGADGISFFLLDDAVVTSTWDVPLDSGAFGGSLGYTCTNGGTTPLGGNYDTTVRSDKSIRGYDGIIGAYMALGVDEFGNFLNSGDNTASGAGLQANRIGLRGAGSIAWKWLAQTYPKLYPTTWTNAQQAADRKSVV